MSDPMIYIDADASPVTDDVIQLASQYELMVTLVKSYAHFSHKSYPDHVKEIYVDQLKEAADYEIMSRIKGNDFLVTQDYGLASLALSKGAHVIHPKGRIYHASTIDQLLASRYISQQIRKKGGRTKGPKPFTEEDHTYFIEQFSFLLKRFI